MLAPVQRHPADSRRAGPGFTNSPMKCATFVAESGIDEGLLTIFCRHTSASLLIQENAAPAARRDLEPISSGSRPKAVAYEHDDEGPDDMPAHLRSALTADPAVDPGPGRPADARHVAGHLPVRAPPRHAPSARSRFTWSANEPRSVRAWLAQHAPDLRLIEVDGHARRRSRRPRRRLASSRAGSPRRSRCAPAIICSCSSRAAMRGSTTASARTSSAPGRACSDPRKRSR